MALDEALLEWLRAQPPEDDTEPTLIIRTYQWEEPTLSLGVHQNVRDIHKLFALYGSPERPVNAVVRRPTGGRAILHGEDVSFSFVTNAPALLKLSLKDSYAVLAGIAEAALIDLGVPVHLSRDAGDRDYLRSPVCFQTQTASDLLDSKGRKLMGSAQLRRAGGILQHGAIFTQGYDVSEADLSQALFDATAAAYDTACEPLPLEPVQPLLEATEANYRRDSDEILARASTTDGSHLAPASA